MYKKCSTRRYMNSCSLSSWVLYQLSHKYYTKQFEYSILPTVHLFGAQTEYIELKLQYMMYID